MKRALLLLALAIAGSAQATPELGWKEISSRTLGLKMRGATVVQLTNWNLRKPPDGRYKFSVEADSPVSFAVLPYDPVNFKVDASAKKAICSQSGALTVTTECTVPESDPFALVIVDERDLGTGIAAIVAAVRMDSQTIDRAVRPNRVKLVLSRWECIRNCSLKR